MSGASDADGRPAGIDAGGAALPPGIDAATLAALASAQGRSGPFVSPIANEQLTASAKVWQAPSFAPPPPGPSLEQLEEIERAAQEEGFHRGHAEGFARGEADVRRLIAQLSGILDSFTRPLSQLDSELDSVLAELSVRVAGALMRREYAADPELVAALSREALLAVGHARDVELRLHPDDAAVVQPLVDVGSARLVPDTTLGRGDVRVHAESVRIDATLGTRLASALASFAKAP